MRPRLAALAALTILALASPSSAQNACGPGSASVYAPGCDGPPTLTCSHGVSLPAISEWCACDGRTVSAPSMAPPEGLRYRHEGACAVTTHFEVTDERRSETVRTGRVVVFMAVGGGSREVARVAGPCRAVGSQAGELGRLACGPRGASALTLRRVGDSVVASSGARELGRMPVSAGQRVTEGALRRM